MSLGELNIKEVTTKEYTEWEDCFRKTNTASISQDWEYGNIRSKINNWPVKRFKIIKADKLIAIFQVYERKFPLLKFISLSYLNRGPLFIDLDTYQENIEQVYKFLKKKYSLLHGKMMVINPLLQPLDSTNSIMKKSGYINFRKREYITSYLNLSTTEQELRKNLKTKWRNQLNTAEKKGLQVIIDTEGKYDEFIKEQYKKMTEQKQFQGLNMSEIDSVFKAYRKLNRLYVFVALSPEFVPIAFTCMLGYGKEAVYLIGWIADEGRQYNPSNLLLWNAIVHLKQCNYSTLDLGGLDPEHLPGVTKFKQGVGGTDVTYSEGWLSI